MTNVISSELSLFDDNNPLNFSDAEKLLEIKNTFEVSEQKLFLNSALVFTIASWQAEIEKSVDNLFTTLDKTFDNFFSLPIKIREVILKYRLKENKNINIDTAYNSYVESDSKWREIFKNLKKGKVDQFNTPNIEKISNLYEDIFGILDINRLFDDPVEKQHISTMLDIRHQIVHGDSYGRFDVDDIKKYINILNGESYKIINDAEGAIYSIRSWGLPRLIEWIVNKGLDKSFSTNELVIPVFNSNHNKLSYSSWGLLEGKIKNRKPTNRLKEFVNNELKIPEKIKLISKGDYFSVPIPDTMMVSWDDIKPNK